VRSLGVDLDWVDDIAQEAFVTAYRQWESFDLEQDFGKWPRRIAAIVVRNWYLCGNRHDKPLKRTANSFQEI
jgi:DNA-directed RNA polymerase specialized sigma24 family protein